MFKIEIPHHYRQLEQTLYQTILKLNSEFQPPVIINTYDFSLDLSKAVEFNIEGLIRNTICPISAHRLKYVLIGKTVRAKS